MNLATYAFDVCWFDQVASLKRFYKLLYHVRKDGADEIELFDVKTRRTFLKRTHYPTLALDDLFIGAKVTIYARQMEILAYADEVTRRALEKEHVRCCAVVSEAGLPNVGLAWAKLNEAGLKLAKLKTVSFSRDDAAALFGPRGFGVGLTVVMELVGPDVSSQWEIIADSLGDNFIGAPSAGVAAKWLDAVFGPPGTRLRSATDTTARLDTCTCAVVLPHAIAKGVGGHVLDMVLKCGLQVTAMQLFDVDLPAAEEFYEVYKGVVPDFMDMARELSTTTLLAVELSGEDAVHRFREVAGPRDVDVARRVRRHTIRGTFGIDDVKCAVHCTDLEEDGPSESEYWFSIMAESQ